MSKAEHTQGPWHTDSLDGVIVYAGDGFAVASAAVFHGRHGGKEVAQANARLIAAAPDLLAALCELDRIDNIKRNAGTQEYASGSIHAKAWKNARFAIAKAKEE